MTNKIKHTKVKKIAKKIKKVSKSQKSTSLHKVRKDLEFKLQKQFTKYLVEKNKSLPKTDRIEYCASTRDEVSHIRRAVRCKQKGYVAGTPDFHVYEPRGEYGGFFIEFKSPGKKPRPVQKERLSNLKDRNYYTFYTDDYFDAISRLEWYLAMPQPIYANKTKYIPSEQNNTILIKEVKRQKRIVVDSFFSLTDSNVIELE